MRLKEDSTSWKSRSIIRRDFRHDPGLPEAEIPKHTGLKRNKKKHVHKYVQRKIGREKVISHYWLNGKLQRIEREQDKFIYVCEGCGNKRRYHYGSYWY